MKGTVDIRRVATPARQRLVASRKRTLRRRSVRAARHEVRLARSDGSEAATVWSGSLSCVVECRNFIVEVFLLDPGGTAPCRALLTKCGVARPASECGAEGCVDIPGTWESLCFPVRKTTGEGRSRKPTPKADAVDSVGAAVKNTGSGRVPVRKLNTSGRGSGIGSLSRLIVAFESRETFSGGSL